jgi:hypothetical protein
MGTKRRCPTCGAKNEMTVRRCRVCTTVINAEVPEGGPEPEVPAAPAAVGDRFDAGVIDRQLQPARSKFGGGSGALAARLAAANGGEIPASYAIPSSDAGPVPASPQAAAPEGSSSLESFEPLSFDPSAPADLAPPGPPTAPPIEYEAEPFDPDALFRDGG